MATIVSVLVEFEHEMWIFDPSLCIHVDASECSSACKENLCFCHAPDSKSHPVLASISPGGIVGFPGFCKSVLKSTFSIFWG